MISSEISLIICEDNWEDSQKNNNVIVLSASPNWTFTEFILSPYSIDCSEAMIINPSYPFHKVVLNLKRRETYPK